MLNVAVLRLMVMKKIHVGFLLSYDYEKLKQSIPPVYDLSDAIYIAMDKEQRTWSGTHFDIEDDFFKWLHDFDVDNKIIVYKDDFCKKELIAIENDTRERHMLSKKMGIGNWLVQVDADEIFIDFEKFVQTLRSFDYFLDDPEAQHIQISGFLINVFKHVDGGILYVNEPTKVLLATNYPNYKVARKTKERIIYTDNVLLHECLARTEEDLQFKLDNWGHKHQLNDGFFDKWRKANSKNYKTIEDVFYMEPHKWKRLSFFPTQNLNEIKTLIEQDDQLKPSKFYLFKKNVGQWIKFLDIFNTNPSKDFEPYL